MFLSNLPCATWLLFFAGFVQAVSSYQGPNVKEIADSVDLLLNSLEEGLTLIEFDAAVYVAVVALDRSYLNKTIYNEERSKHKLDIGDAESLIDRVYNESDVLEDLWEQFNISFSDDRVGKETIDLLLAKMKDTLFDIASLVKTMIKSPQYKDAILSHRSPRQVSYCDDPCYYNSRLECSCPYDLPEYYN